MNQYSAKNQISLAAQAGERGMPLPTDVRPFKQWQAAGRSVKKGEKALRVWIPKTGAPKNADPNDADAARLYFRQGPVFDISQTEPTEERERRTAERKAARATRGSTITTPAGIIIAQQRHIDA